jgi:hypothetical protein
MVVDDSEEEIGDDSDTSGILMDDLSWRVEKLRLEERNKERFLKAGPRGVDGKAKRNGTNGSPWEKNETPIFLVDQTSTTDVSVNGYLGNTF